MWHNKRYESVHFMRSRGCPVKDIAKELGISTIYVAKIIEELAENGYCKPLELTKERSCVLDGSVASCKVTGDDRWFDGCVGIL